MSEEKPVLSRIEDGVCWITLNRPAKLNTIVPEMLDLMSEALDRAEVDGTVRCVAITGAGDRAFCAGADVSFLSTLSVEDAKAFSRRGHRTFLKILRIPKPVVAAVNGYALGGGCELAVACDIRIASEKARFGQTEINLGLIPGWGGTQLLPKIVGTAKAKELILMGATLNANEALQAGIVSKVVTADKFSDEVKAAVGILANGPRIAIAEAKKLINAGLSLEAGLASEAESFGRLFATADMKEGVAAFAGKRKPVFKNNEVRAA